MDPTLLSTCRPKHLVLGGLVRLAPPPPQSDYRALTSPHLVPPLQPPPPPLLHQTARQAQLVEAWHLDSFDPLPLSHLRCLEGSPTLLLPLLQWHHLLLQSLLPLLPLPRPPLFLH